MTRILNIERHGNLAKKGAGRTVEQCSKISYTGTYCLSGAQVVGVE